MARTNSKGFPPGYYREVWHGGYPAEVHEGYGPEPSKEDYEQDLAKEGEARTDKTRVSQTVRHPNGFGRGSIGLHPSRMSNEEYQRIVNRQRAEDEARYADEQATILERQYQENPNPLSYTPEHIAASKKHANRKWKEYADSKKGKNIRTGDEEPYNRSYQTLTNIDGDPFYRGNFDPRAVPNVRSHSRARGGRIDINKLKFL